MKRYKVFYQLSDKEDADIHYKTVNANSTSDAIDKVKLKRKKQIYIAGVKIP